MSDTPDNRSREAGEPIYQWRTKHDGEWQDVPAEGFENIGPSFRRIVYGELTAQRLRYALNALNRIATVEELPTAFANMALNHIVGPEATREMLGEHAALSASQQKSADQRDRLLSALERATRAESALRALVDECGNDTSPGWEDRMQSCIEEANRVLASQPKPLTDEQRDAVRTAIAESLGEAYDCTRVWSAWSYGTMGPDDFRLVAEDDARLDEIADAVFHALESTK
jgi:hypothetical protein